MGLVIWTMFIMLFTLKIAGVSSVSWGIVFSPLLVPLFIIAVLTIFILFYGRRKK